MILNSIKEIFEFQYTAHFDNWLTENEYDHVFLWEYEWEIIPNPNEVNDYKWISIDELKTDIKHNSELYSEWFKIILDKAISVKYLFGKNQFQQFSYLFFSKESYVNPGNVYPEPSFIV